MLLPPPPRASSARTIPARWKRRTRPRFATESVHMMEECDVVFEKVFNVLYAIFEGFNIFDLFLARAPTPQGEPTLVKVPKPTGIRAAMHVTFDCPHFETEQQLQQRLQLRFWVKN